MDNVEDEDFVSNELKLAAQLYQQRNRVYGDTYKEFGKLLVALHPSGITLQSEDDFNRFGVYMQVLGKLKRYSVNFETGGHVDSLKDLAVYATMLQELDHEHNNI